MQVSIFAIAAAMWAAIAVSSPISSEVERRQDESQQQLHVANTILYVSLSEDDNDTH